MPLASSAALNDIAGRVAAFIGGPSTGDSFEVLALDLYARQFEANPAYRKLSTAVGRTPATVRTWREIPAVPTTAFKLLELTCLEPAERTVVFHSSGTTASHQPSRHFHNAASLALYELSASHWFRRHLLADQLAPGTLRSDLAWISLTPPSTAAPHSSLVHMLARAVSAPDEPLPSFFGLPGQDGAWEMDLPSLAQVLNAATANRQPIGLLGTAFNFVHLLDYLTGTTGEMTLPAGSRIMETGGYKGRSRQVPRDQLHSDLSRLLGVPEEHIISEYGMSELSSQAYDGAIGEAPHSGSRGSFQFPPWTRFEIISPETGRQVSPGELGLLKIWDLANVWSVMAVQTSDLARQHGDRFELVGRAPAAEPRGCSLMTMP